MWLLGAGSCEGLCGGEGALVGKKQTCYLVMGTPFLLNEMIAGGVPELWRSLWLASWSPETPGGGLARDRVRGGRAAQRNGVGG